MATNTTRTSSIPVLAALLCAAFAALLVSGWMRQVERSVAAKADLASVVVTAQNVPLRTQLAPNMVRLESYPRHLLPPGSIQEVGQAVGQYSRSALAPSQLLTSALLSSAEELDGISREIAVRRRAVAVPVDIGSGVALQIREGDRVDVMVTLDNLDGEPIAKTVLQNVRILKLVGLDPKSDSQKTRNATVILDVDVEAAEKIALLLSEGSITLALRGSADDAPVRTRGVTVRQALLDIPATPGLQFLASMLPKLSMARSAPAAMPPPPAAASRSVELFLGMERQEIVFNKERP